MKKIIVLVIVIGLLLTSSLASANAFDSMDLNNAPESTTDINNNQNEIPAIDEDPVYYWFEDVDVTVEGYCGLIVCDFSYIPMGVEWTGTIDYGGASTIQPSFKEMLHIIVKDNYGTELFNKKITDGSFFIHDATGTFYIDFCYKNGDRLFELSFDFHVNGFINIGVFKEKATATGTSQSSQQSALTSTLSTQPTQSSPSSSPSNN